MGSGLSPIEATDDPGWRPPGVTALLAVVFTAGCVVLWVWTAYETWSLRTEASFPLGIYACAAIVSIVIPLAGIAYFLRRDIGRAAIPALAAMFAVVTWLCYLVFAVFSDAVARAA